MINDIFLKEVENGSFSGTIYSNMLPLELKNEFPVNEELQVYGRFKTEIEGKMLLVSLDSLSLTDGNREINLNLDKLDGNEIYDLEEKLTNIGYKENWQVNINEDDEGEYYE